MSRMHSFLIVGGDKEEREKKAKKLSGNIHPVDTLTLRPDPSIGIEQIRELTRDFHLRPIKSQQKVAFIFEAQKMTIPAQNALLKTLEEPPGENFLILTTPNPGLLLPTISSRTHILSLSPKSEIVLEKEAILIHWQNLRQILKSGVGKRLLLSEDVSKDRQTAIEWLKMQTVLWRQVLLNSQDCTQIISADLAHNLKDLSKTISVKLILETLKNIQHTQKMLDGNVHVKLAIDNLLLEYPSFSQPD